MLKKLVIPTAVVTAFAFTPVLAEQSGDGGGSRADRQQEMEAGSQSTAAGAETFDELDQNKDGKLDEDELNTWGSTAAGPSDEKKDSKRGEKMMEKYDKDGDGAVSREEMDQGLNEGTGEGTGSGAQAGDDM